MCRGPGNAGTLSAPCEVVVDVLVVEVVFTETQDNAPVATLLEWFAAHHRHVMMG
jgi:hypothetical protein